ncbi:MAG: 6-pyruvoyl tetrahydropterin reductase [Gammaproteobacteria bacterium]|nr:MAG: 6-pyruvoyl tetrahydropterin reductase [Gammaproteobacteria bacterium]
MNRLFVDNLTVIDFAFLDSKRGIVGESWIVDVELEGELDEQGMVFDFGEIKKSLKNLVDEIADHKLIVAAKMPGLVVKQTDNRHDIGFHNQQGEKWLHRSPSAAVLLIDNEEVSPEAVSTYLVDQFDQILPDNVDGVSVVLRTGNTRGAYYHYCHGLKKHRGNCQRIAHGHRSKIEILVNNLRDEQLEKEWANRLQDIYIGTREDIDLEASNRENNLTFCYTAEQGYFAVSLPQRCVYLIETDSTVEWIATHIADQIKSQLPDCDIQVKAFEGVGKGAIAEK